MSAEIFINSMLSIKYGSVKFELTRTDRTWESTSYKKKTHKKTPLAEKKNL